MGLSKSSTYFTVISTSFIPVSLFDLEGPPGVDGQDFADIEAYGVQRWLGELALARSDVLFVQRLFAFRAFQNLPSFEILARQSPEAGVGSSPMLQSAELQYHHYANIFPLLDGDEDGALVDSIAKSGIREPIVLHEDKILDGRNRYRAARKLNLPITKIPIRKFDPEREGDPIDFVWDENVNRRHLNETQRGLAAAEMETLRHGGKRKFQEPHAALEEKPATRMELGRRYGVGHVTMYSGLVSAPNRSTARSTSAPTSRLPEESERT
jgi:hypothetical protein